MPGYKRPCRHCGELVPPDSNVCPFCSRVNPRGPLRCPGCRNPVKKGWKSCSNCGLGLETTCPGCGEQTFFGDYCEECGERLTVTCPGCGEEQPPLEENCVDCGEPLE